MFENWQFHPIIALQIVIGVFSIFAAMKRFREDEFDGARETSLLQIQVAIWTLGSALQFMSIEANASFFWSAIEYAGLFGTPISVFAFARAYLQKPKSLGWRSILLLSAIPVATFFLFLSNESHHLIMTRFEMVAVDGYIIRDQAYGPAFYFFALYAFGLLGDACYQFLVKLRGEGRLSWRQNAAIVITISIVVIVSSAHLLGYRPRIFEIVSLVATCSILVVSWNLQKLRAGDLLSVSREIILDKIPDSIIVADDQLRIVHVNSPAARLLSGTKKDLIGRNLSDLSPLIKSHLDKPRHDRLAEIETMAFPSGKQCLLDSVAIEDDLGQPTGHVITVRDVTQLEQERERTLREASISKAALIMRSTLDTDEVLNLLVEQMGKAIDASSAYILRFDHDTLICGVVAEYYGPQASAEERVSDLGEHYDLTYMCEEEIKAFDDGIPSVDHVNSPKIHATLREEMIKFGARSVLTIPLQIKGETIALAELWESRHHREFTQKEIELCMAIAQHGAVALEYARIHSRTAGQLEKQIALREAFTAISSTLSLREVLELISEKMCRAVNGTSAYICDWDDKNMSTIVLADYYAEDANELERISDLAEAYSVADQVEWVDRMKSGLPDTVSIDDPDLTEEDMAHLERFGGKSILYVPISIRGELVSIAELWDSRTPRCFTPEEISLVSDIAHQAGLAIHNAHLYGTIVEEINERKRMEEQLIHDAFHDKLTGLPNRALLLDRLQQTMVASKRKKHGVYAVLFLDLDRFKIVNDSLGHSAGDRLLVAVGERLRESIREEDTLARIGGDEFVILLKEIQGIVDATRIASRVLENLSRGFPEDRSVLHISASIGIVFGSKNYRNPEDILRDADIAMYRAKDSGRSQYAIFDKEMLQEVTSILKAETELRSAVENEEFELHYQPVFSLNDLEIIGMEALVRWQHPERGLVYPDKFISLAEENGMIVSIDFWVIAEACRQLHEWHMAGLMTKEATMSVNLSGPTLEDPRLINHIKSVIKKTEINPNCLVLEIIERAILSNFESSRNVLEALKELGIMIHMDDFGSGHSSLNVLRQLPIDTIKIDQSFIASLQAGSDNLEIVRAIVRLGTGLKKNVIAEGIETDLELELLRKAKCLQGQGHWLGGPSTAQRIQDMVAERRVDASG